MRQQLRHDRHRKVLHQGRVTLLALGRATLLVLGGAARPAPTTAGGDRAARRLRASRAPTACRHRAPRALVDALAGADYLGSLLRVDRSIADQLEKYTAKEDLFSPRLPKLADDAKDVLLAKLEQFLDAHSAERDLGLRLEGEQLAAGVRFLRVVREGQYDIVVGNPPYQGLSKTERFGYVATHYKKGKADLYAAFLERGLQLTKPGGLSALLTMRGWMFLGQFAELRKELHDAGDGVLFVGPEDGDSLDLPACAALHAALWPLLELQWKDPKKWWKELANAQGKKDYDWAHLAKRYWPTRVDAKCQDDPSLGVAHACFWKYHPAKGYAWELRL